MIFSDTGPGFFPTIFPGIWTMIVFRSSFMTSTKEFHFENLLINFIFMSMNKVLFLSN